MKPPSPPTPRSNEEYGAWGQPPPESTPHGTEADIEAHLKSQFGRGHLWHQQGNVIFCTSCPFRHGASVPTNYLLTGTDKKGLPIFKRLDNI